MSFPDEHFSILFVARCGRAILQSTVVVDLLEVQVLEEGPVTEVYLQHLAELDEITSQCKMYKSDLFKVVKVWCTT